MPISLRLWKNSFPVASSGSWAELTTWLYLRCWSCLQVWHVINLLMGSQHPLSCAPLTVSICIWLTFDIWKCVHFQRLAERFLCKHLVRIISHLEIALCPHAPLFASEDCCKSCLCIRCVSKGFWDFLPFRYTTGKFLLTVPRVQLRLRISCYFVLTLDRSWQLNKIPARENQAHRVVLA